ncbi:ATP-dependent DNA helicase RecG [Aminicella lysinilytica]|uniref:ATP-dependent DNA helicase RecG n=1 Tax=Aminicella lysinilytica TaxID=433323 RepID=A0A4R6PXT4_9FIRM|nr:ATP-dependent DNA helicase RecG [Aminicella lysinilytica]NLD11361.1 ATP-dependent DNA helicase RecG [Clostridiales bacterium]TDP49866.1 ATP-dependent DNA helicase RecG [Aminicella lysinilytica]
MDLKDKITTLKGIGPKKGKVLSEHGIKTIEDLIEWFPRRYEDRRRETPICDVKQGKDYLVCGKVISRRQSGNPYNKRAPLSLLINDDSGMIEIVFFNGKYLSGAFNVNSKYSFYGKVSENMGRMQMIHPEFHQYGEKGDIRGIIPVYPTIEGISQNEMRKIQAQVSPAIESVREWLPENIVTEYKLADPVFSLKNIHFPKESRYVLMSRFRLVFDELLTLETGLIYVKNDNAAKKNGIAINTGRSEEFINNIGFKLTEGQTRVWSEVAKDLESTGVMNRLIQGDVGSGKTAIAEIAMYVTVCNGYQAVMMAPTEILAKQHYVTLTEAFREYNLKIGLLCGSMKPADKKEVLDRLGTGEIDILVGTHAIIQPGVKFNRLGLVITDEQHRFGVEQRHRLSEKGDDPNIMVMTATPIPRTLAVILYGELDISVIDTMPAGRKPIRTIAAHQEDRGLVYDKVRKELVKGKQAYVVAPLIEESEKIDAKSASELFAELQKLFKDYKVGLIHGSLPQEQKDAVMDAFVKGEIDVLVSTVVIEIGINVQNATVMVIENCERFGLAQLHQLRGRVGRGNDQSFCYLIINNETDIAAERVKIMCESTDGFQIAEEDLRLRGPGEIFGTRQHGLPEMRISDIVRHADVLEKAKNAANSLLASDPDLRSTDNAELRNRIEKMFGGDIRLEI